MDLLACVRRTIRQHSMADASTRVLLAVSGGSDSVALAELAHALAAEGDLRVVAVAHFNHQLRDTAARDEAFCRALADRLGWPIIVEREDVAERAKRERRSLEDAAHVARYAFFERARTQSGADVVALGHTRDDQAETFLLRLLRGAGARGLAGMHPRHGAIVRPLLDCRRADLREYLAARGVSYVEDETNADVEIARNRVRAELLPLVESRFNPRIVDTLATEADLARDEWLWMDEAARAFESAARRDESGAIALELDALASAPPALRRLVVRNAMIAAARGRTISYDHVAAALRLMEMNGARGGVDAPGHRVERDGNRLVLTSRPDKTTGRWRSATPPNVFEYPLSIPGEVVLPQAGCAISAEPVASGVNSSARAAVSNDVPGADVAIVRADLCRGSLKVRNRRPGDHFRPAGGGRRKKLQDFFVDTKVARAIRDGVPIVVDGDGRIVWVAGHAIDAAFRVTNPAQGMLILRLRRV
jgi:tRNA(Ile)-lysidine synthase